MKDDVFKKELIKKLQITYKKKKRRNLIIAILLSLFILFMELFILIILDIIQINVIYAIIAGVIGIISFAIGFYLLITESPIYVEYEDDDWKTK